MRGRNRDSSDEDRAEAKISEWLVDDENTQVEKWRMHVLSEVGYPVGIAQRLAMSLSVDIHVACEILKGGCSPETAAEILL